MSTNKKELIRALKAARDLSKRMSTNKKELIMALEAARDLSKGWPKGERQVQIRGEPGEVVVRADAPGVWYECRIPSEGEGGWSVAMDGADLLRAARVTFDLETISGEAGVEFSEIPEFEPTASARISAQALARVSTFMGGPEKVLWQQSVQVYSRDGTLQITATDGHRAARETVSSAVGGLDMAIPAAMVKIAVKCFEGEVLVQQDARHVRLVCEGQTLTGRAVELEAPEKRPTVDRPWPTKFQGSALVDAERLARLVRGAGTLSEELVEWPLAGNVTLALKTVPPRVVVSAAAIPGVLSLPLDAEVLDDANTTVFSDQLLDALSSVSGKVRVRIAEHENPTLRILEISSGNFACIIMPIRVK